MRPIGANLQRKRAADRKHGFESRAISVRLAETEELDQVDLEFEDV